MLVSGRVVVFPATHLLGGWAISVLYLELGVHLVGGLFARICSQKKTDDASVFQYL